MSAHDGLKLTAYFGERDRVGGRYLSEALLSLYARERLRASVLLRGSEGFGAAKRLQTTRLLTLSEDLPLVAVAVDRRERIEPLIAAVTALGAHGLVTLERVRLLTDELAPPPLAPDEAIKLTVVVGRDERAGSQPAHAAVCELLRRHGVAGATALLGVDGTAHGTRTRASLLGRNGAVPVLVVAVGDGARIAAALPALGLLLRRRPATLERVRVCKRDGVELAPPQPLAGRDAHGLPLWQKLTVYTSERTLHGGRPAHLELVRRLRDAGAAGATTLRAVLGYHGDGPLHRDRLLQLRRHVPALTVVVDTPERIAAAYAIADELTAERGLVTSEVVPASAPLPHDGAGGAPLALASP